MAKLSASSFSEAMPAELSLFSLPPTQVAVTDAYFEEIRPISQIGGDVPIEFKISSSNGLDYLDLKGSQLYVKLTVTKPNGEALTTGEHVGPVNLLLQSLFSTTEVTLQNKVTMVCNLNPFMAMIQELLYCDEDANLSQMASQLYVKDDYDSIADANSAGSNSGLVDRTAFVSMSKVVDMCGPIYHPLFNIGRYLLNQVDVKLKLYRSTPSFCLMSTDENANYVINLLDICLLARKIRVDPAVIYGHAEIIKDVNARYPFTLTECRLQSVAQGASSFSWDAIFQGKKPAKVVIGFVDAVAISGNYKTNPFNFENCDISEICLYADGIPVGGAPIKLNFEKTQGQIIARAYSELFRYADKWERDSGNDLSRDDFVSGSTLFAFQLEPYYDGQNTFVNLLKTGNVRLNVQFSKALTKTMTCIVFSQTPAYFEINAARDIIME